MTQVLFAFRHPDGKPLVGAGFTIQMRRPGMIPGGGGVIVPESLSFVTNEDGTAIVELQPSTSVYLLVLADSGDACSGVRYKFYVPESSAIIDAEDLYLAPPPNSEPWDETAIQMLTDAKAAAIAAANAAGDYAAEAQISAVSAAAAAERAASAVEEVDLDIERAERARDASEAYSLESLAARAETDADRIAAQLAATAAGTAAKAEVGVLRKELASPSGATGVVWERGERTPLYTGIGGFMNITNFNLWEPEFVAKAVKPNPVDPATWDWAPALQAAIAKVVLLAQIKNNTYGLPGIDVPAFVYKMLSTIRTAPWIKINVIGNTVFDFSAAPVGTQGVDISGGLLNVTADKFSFTGACLNADRGNLHLLGSGLSSSKAAGIFAGNKADGMPVAREITLKNVTCRNWQNALEFGRYGSYLFSADGLRLENNFNGIVSPEGIVRNSGEKMVFTNSIVAGTGLGGAAIIHRCDTLDMSFTNTSFDFNHDIVRCDPGASYATIKFSGLCHFEGWDGFLVNWRSNGANFYITFDKSCTVLPTTYRLPQPLVLNSASRPLVSFGGTEFSRVSVRMDAPIIRYTYLPWTEDPFVDTHENHTTSQAGRKSIKFTNYEPYSFSAYGSRYSVANTDFDFQKDPIGTLIADSKCWARGGNTEFVSGVQIVDDGNGKKVLQMVGAGINSYFPLVSKQYYPVTPGDTVYAWSAISMKGLTPPEGSNTDLPNIQLGVEFQYADGTISRAPSITANMGRQFKDTQVPNFAEGNNRYIASTSYGTLIPEGVVAVRPYTLYTNFVGKLYISRNGIWKQ